MATAGIPFLPNHWYYNTESGELTNGNNLENLGNNLFGGLGWHELHIPGSATEAQAAAEARKEFPHGTPPTTSLAKGAVNTLQNATGIGAFLAYPAKILAWISNRSNAVRVAKVVIGGTMILVGVNMLVKNETNIDVMGAVKTAAKVVK